VKPTLYELWPVEPDRAIPPSPYPLDEARLGDTQRTLLRDVPNFLVWETNGSQSLPWRYQPRRIELGVLVTPEVLTDLLQVFGSAVADLGAVRLSAPDGKDLDYHHVNFESERVEVKGENCRPPIPDPSDIIAHLEVRDERREQGEITSIAIPIDAASLPLLPPHPLPSRLVTNQTRDNWRMTESSRRLQSDPTEFDLLFNEFAAPAGPATDYLDYHWIE